MLRSPVKGDADKEPSPLLPYTAIDSRAGRRGQQPPEMHPGSRFILLLHPLCGAIPTLRPTNDRADVRCALVRPTSFSLLSMDFRSS